NEGLKAWAERMPVPLKLLVFEVQRLMAHGRGLPHVCSLFPTAAFELLAVIDRTLEGIILALGPTNANVQFHLVDGVSAEVFQTLVARFLRLAFFGFHRGGRR